MAKKSDLSKVLKALEIVLNDCLSVKSDDTLQQKLFTLLKHDLNLSAEEKQSVLRCVEKYIDFSAEEFDPNSDYNDWSLIAVKLRICGSLLADEDLFVSQQTCLRFIEIMATEVVNSPKILLKCSFFVCLNDISGHKSGTNWILNCNLEYSQNFKTFPQILWHFFNKTETVYIEREVRKLFICLTNKCIKENEMNPNLNQLIRKLIADISPSNIAIINDLLLTIEAKSEFINEYNLINAFIDCIDVWIQQFPQKLHILAQVLGLCVKTNEKAVEISDKLISSNQLTSLIAFLTNFINHNPNCDQTLNKLWFKYTIGSLAIDSQQMNRLEMSVQEMQSIEQLSNKTIYCLHQMTKLNPNLLDSKQIILMIEILFQFIKSNHLKTEMRKTLIQCFSVLETMSSDSRPETRDNFLRICSQLLPILSMDYKLVILKSLRISMKNNFDANYIQQNRHIIDILEQLNDILSETEINDNNWEVKDSVLEVVYAFLLLLSKNSTKVIADNMQLTSLPKLMSTITFMWSSNDSLCPTIRSTLVSILLLVCLTESDLKEFNVSTQKPPDLQSISSLLLTDELNVKEVIIKTLEENVISMLNIETENDQSFAQIITTLCIVSVKDLDEDLQITALHLLSILFDGLSQRKSIISTIQTFFKCLFFNTIYHLITSSEYLFKVKLKCLEIIESFRTKAQAIDAITGGTPLSCAQEVISDPNLDNNMRSMLSVDRNTISNFMVNFDTKSFAEMGGKDCPELSVLDDILSVALIDSNILADCY